MRQRIVAVFLCGCISAFAAAGAGAINGAAGGAVNVVVNQGIENGSVNGGDVAEGALAGAIGGGLAVPLGPEVNGGRISIRLPVREHLAQEHNNSTIRP